MNSVKLENMTVTLSREEASWWRRKAATLKVRGRLARSRGDFQKYCLALGVAQLCRKSARELARLRQDFSPRALAGLVLLFTLCGGSTAQLVMVKHAHHDLRTRCVARHTRAQDLVLDDAPTA